MICLNRKDKTTLLLNSQCLPCLGGHRHIEGNNKCWSTGSQDSTFRLIKATCPYRMKYRFCCFTVLAERVGYYVLLYYSNKSWSIFKSRDRFKIYWSCRFQSTLYMYNLTKFWLRYLRLTLCLTNDELTSSTRSTQ